MTALARTFRNSTYTRSSIIVTGVVLLFVIGMFFIPELIDFQRSIGNPSSPAGTVNFAGTGASRIADTQPSDENLISPSDLLPSTGRRENARAMESESPLAAIVRLIDSGYSEQKSTVAGQELAVETTPRSPSLNETLSDKGISWDALRSAESVSILNKARSDALALADAMPKDKEGTKFALLNFANGARLVTEGGQRGMTPQMALEYLESLDYGVTRAMVKEGVDRVEYMRWSEISLGSLMDGSRLVRAKREFRMEFRPKMGLDTVRLASPPGWKKEYVDDNPLGLDLAGFVTGRDVERVDLYADGQFRGNLLLTKPDLKDVRHFQWVGLDGKKIYTLRAYDRYGNTYEKSYQFFPRVRRFPWTPANVGRFMINFNSGVIDPAVDQFFLYRAGHLNNQESRGFATF